MRKVSYTQMRAELSDILDAIRNGDTIVVTQRGRPDTILKGSVNQESTVSLNPWRPAAESQQSDSVHVDVVRNSHGQTKYVTKTANGQVINEIIISDSRVSFNDALKKTQLKHAKIIKALEDK
jgi:antitoxin Phd